jgi:acetyl esterase/lipase
LLRSLIIFCAFMSLASPAAAETGGASVMFGARESVGHVDLSPSGRHVVYLEPGPGTSTIAMVVDLGGSRQAVPIFRSTGQPDRLRWCRFVTDVRLVCSMFALVDIEGELVPFTRLFAVGSDGRNLRELGQRPSFHDERVRQFDGDILDWLPNEDGAVLMSRDYVPEADTTDTRIYRREDGLGVDRIDINSLRSTSIERPNREAAGYITDGQGNVRIMELSRASGATGQFSSTTRYLYRLAGSSEWRPFGSFDSSTGLGMIPLAVDAARNAAYVLKKLDGRFALYRVGLSATPDEELVYANDRVDVDDVVRIGRSGTVIGVTFAEERRQTVYFDPEIEQITARFARALPELTLVNFPGASRDNGKLLMFAGSDRDPGHYYVYDRATRQFEEIMLARPQLEGTALATVRPISYPAIDGTSIPAYLTLPPGREEARNLPAIVLPHGGPAARDEWGFDWLVQFLANRGYAVLQPNFRGSGGYGDEWLSQNGFRGWATSIGDVTAGAQWLVSQEIADPQRLAVVGWSYGGYAALQSAVTQPDLFKAVVAIAPVTDLALLGQQARGFAHYRLLRDYIGSGPHIEQGSPLRNVARIAAPVMMFHGSRDLNVAVDHSEQMDRALRAAGKSSQLTVFQGLEHDLADSEARTRMLDQIEQFLAAGLGGR